MSMSCLEMISKILSCLFALAIVFTLSSGINRSPSVHFIEEFFVEIVLFHCQKFNIFGGFFNSNAFIRVTDFPTFGELVEFVKQVKDDKDSYKDFLCAPLFNGKNMQKFYTDRLESFLVGVVECGSVLIHLYGRQGLKLYNNLIIS